MRSKFFCRRRALLLLAALGCLLVALLCKEQWERRLYPLDYAEHVSQYADKYGVDEHIIYAVIKTESDFDSSAVSRAGAIGLMQITPDTFRWLTDYHLKEELDPSACYDAKTNIRYGVYYLSFLYERYEDWTAVWAAYNAGPGRVDQWLLDASLTDADGALMPSRIPFGETRAYVQRVRRTTEIYKLLYPDLD